MNFSNELSKTFIACPKCQNTRYYSLADRRLKCQACGYKYSINSMWNRHRISEDIKRRILFCFVEGFSAGRTAKGLKLSNRTVENFYKDIRESICTYIGFEMMITNMIYDKNLGADVVENKPEKVVLLTIAAGNVFCWWEPKLILLNFYKEYGESALYAGVPYFTGLQLNGGTTMGALVLLSIKRDRILFTTSNHNIVGTLWPNDKLRHHVSYVNYAYYDSGSIPSALLESYREESRGILSFWNFLTNRLQRQSNFHSAQFHLYIAEACFFYHRQNEDILMSLKSILETPSDKLSPV